MIDFRQHLSNFLIDGDKGCLLADVEYETAYMHMDMQKAVLNPFSAYYNSVNILRWVLVAYASLIFDDFPRTMYCILWIVDIVFVALAVLAAPGFYHPCSVFAVLQEVFVLVWHFCHWILWLDVEGRIGYGENWVEFYVGVVSVCVAGAIICELFLLLWAVVGDRCNKDQRPVYEDNAFSELSNNELNNKIQTYNTMRSGVKQQGTNRN